MLLFFLITFRKKILEFVVLIIFFLKIEFCKKEKSSMHFDFKEGNKYKS